MKTFDFVYRVGLDVKFTKKELALLTKLALGHYDYECRLMASVAGTTGAGPTLRGNVNGPLTMAAMSSSYPLNWTFREFDLCAKITEQWMQERDEKRRNATSAIHFACIRAMNAINAEHNRLH